MLNILMACFCITQNIRRKRVTTVADKTISIYIEESTQMKSTGRLNINTTIYMVNTTFAL